MRARLMHAGGHAQLPAGLWPAAAPGGVIDTDARRQLNDAAVAREHAPTTEFDRAENAPQRPPYTRAEFQPEQVQARQQAAANAPVAGPAAPEPAPQPNGMESLSPRDAALFERIRQGYLAPSATSTSCRQC